MTGWRRHPDLLPGAIVAASAFAALWSRLLPLTQSLWADEIHSVVAYIDRGPSAIFSHYVANDHMLFELLAWGWTAVTGDHSEAAYRLWGVAPALAAGVALAWWLWRRLDPWVAAIFSALACASPLYYQLGIEARGYGLAFLGASLMLIGADLFVRSTTTRALGLFVAGAVIGIWALPVFALPYVATTALLLARLREQRRQIALATGLVVIVSVLFYLPVLGDLLTASRQPFSQTLPWDGFATGPFRDLLAPEVLGLVGKLPSVTYTALGPGATAAVPSTAGWPTLVAAVAVLAGVGVAYSARERFLALALLAPAVFTYTVLDISRTHVVNRFASFLLLPLLIACAIALVALGRRIARLTHGAAAAAALGAALALLLLGRTDSLLKLTLAVPYENDRAVAELVAGANVHSVVTNLDGGDVYFYLGRGAIVTPSPAQLQTLFCSHAGPFIYLHELLAPTGPATTCLRARGAISIPIVQRHTVGVSAGAPFVAWLTPGATAPARPTASGAPGGRAIDCRIYVRPAVYTGVAPSAAGRPVPVILPPRGSGSRLVLTVLHAALARSIIGAGPAAGETFTAPNGFVEIEYELANHGTTTVIPVLTVSRLIGLAGDFGGTIEQAGSFDPPCQAAEPSFAAEHHFADPGIPVAPGQQIVTVAVYPLAAVTAVTPYVLAWSAFSPRISVALPRLAP